MTDELPTLRLRLAEAELARHKLLTGNKRIRLMHSGAGVSTSADFSQADVGKLAEYIDELKSRIATLTGEDAGGRRAFSFY
jgi:hypothetical protein